MRYPHVPWVGTLAASGVSSNALSLDDVRKFISEQTKSASVLEDESGHYALTDSAQAMPTDSRVMLASSVSRANTFKDQIAGADTLGLDDIYQQLRDLLLGQQNGQQMFDRMCAILDGCTVTVVDWWGTVMSFTKKAAEALIDLLQTDLTWLIVKSSVLNIKLAALIAFLSIAGHAFSLLISAENGPPGVTIEILLWLIPTVAANPTTSA